MISRKTTLRLARIIEDQFSERISFNGDRLYDFLYEHDHEAWLLNALTVLPIGSAVKATILQLHTGESVPQANWTVEERVRHGNRALHDLCETLLVNWNSLPKGKYVSDGSFNTLARSLELDGYTLRGNRLIANEATVLDTAEQAGVLETLYSELQLPDRTTAIHHLQQSEENYHTGHWDDCISQARKFLECTLAAIAKALVPAHGARITPSDSEKPFQVRDYLEREGLLTTKSRTIRLDEQYWFPPKCRCEGRSASFPSPRFDNKRICDASIQGKLGYLWRSP
jgi:hypothetical protein